MDRTVPSDAAENAFDRAFTAYQRGELLKALMLFEQSFLLDTTHEEALLNYGRTLRILQPGEQKVSERTLRLVSEANGLQSVAKDSENESFGNSVVQSADGENAISRRPRRVWEKTGSENGRARCPYAC